MSRISSRKYLTTRLTFKKLPMKPTLLNLKSLSILLLLLSSAVTAQITPKEAISQMTKGINLGNTLEPPTEGAWGNPSTQEYFFDMYKNEGFKCVRIPVRWDQHMGKTAPYKIDESWFTRVEQILDWGLSRGLFIIVNSHHDNWIKDDYTNPVNIARFDSLWTQVANRFKNKSEKLIFEILNEPHGLTKAQNDDMHGRILSIIRKTNPTRLVIFQGHNWGGDDELISAAIPNDSYLIGSFHSYEPWPFGLEGTGTFTTSDAYNLKTKFQKVKDWSDTNNIPVILGEFGAVDLCEYNSRMKQYKTYTELAETFGFTPCVWDDGGKFKIMLRQSKSWIEDIKDIVVKSSVLSPKNLTLQVFQDSILKLNWVNTTGDYDSIDVERKTAGELFKKIAVLPGNSTVFNDLEAVQEKDNYYRIIGHNNTKTDLYSLPQMLFMPKWVTKEPAVRKLFLGKPIAIPGILQAEDFDIGGDELTYHDTDQKNITGDYRPDEPIDIYKKSTDSYLVIDNFPGEWLEYTVNVATAGQYTITAHIAAFAGNGTFQLKAGANESEIVKAPTSYSWVNTKPVSFSLNLEEGEQIIRISILSSPVFYLDYLDFKRDIPSALIPEKKKDEMSIRQTSQEILISSAEKQIDRFNLYSITGNLVKTINQPGFIFRVQTQEIRSGMYILQLISGKDKTSKKIVIR